ncbi:MAG: DUF1573 domain-containing protein [Deltaproteobacteria bacterium]|nr:DUF1573 domain-containing protein [Deltaproteobacteria bacterium]
MKKILLFSILYALVSLFFNPLGSAEPLKGPQMNLKEKHHDFNEVKEGEVIEHSFTVENQGDQILEIQKVNPG